MAWLVCPKAYGSDLLIVKGKGRAASRQLLQLPGRAQLYRRATLTEIGNLISDIRWRFKVAGQRTVLTCGIGGTMSVTAVLLGAILLVIGCGGIFLYRMLVAITRMLEAIIKLLDSIDHKLPSSRLLTSLLSF